MIAFKYCIVKLIDRHPPTEINPDINGIDMYPLTLFGKKLNIPNTIKTPELAHFDNSNDNEL